MRVVNVISLVVGCSLFTFFSNASAAMKHATNYPQANVKEAKFLQLAARNKKYSRRSSFPRKRAATGRRVFVFSPKKLRWYAYDERGRLVRSGRASGGSHYCRDIGRSCRTPRGVYSVRSKGGAGCRSSRYPLPRGGAPMPYCMFYSKYYAVHGSPHVPNYNASHGCIRVLPSDARWLSSNFMRIGTTVIVTSY